MESSHLESSFLGVGNYSLGYWKWNVDANPTTKSLSNVMSAYKMFSVNHVLRHHVERLYPVVFIDHSYRDLQWKGTNGSKRNTNVQLEKREHISLLLISMPPLLVLFLFSVWISTQTAMFFIQFICKVSIILIPVSVVLKLYNHFNINYLCWKCVFFRATCKYP